MTWDPILSRVTSTGSADADSSRKSWTSVASFVGIRLSMPTLMRGHEGTNVSLLTLKMPSFSSISLAGRSSGRISGIVTPMAKCATRT